MATACQATFSRVVKKRPIRQANEVGTVVDHNMSRESCWSMNARLSCATDALKGAKSVGREVWLIG